MRPRQLATAFAIGESTVYGYEPSPRFGGLVVTMLPGDRLQQKLEVKTDTIDGQVLPVYIPTL